MSFDVRYNKAIGWVFLALGLVVLALNLFVILLTGRFSAGIISGLILPFVALAYLTRPYFTVYGDRVVFHALIGPVKKTRMFKDVRIDGEKVWIEGRRVSGMFADRTDWKKFIAALPRG